MTFDARVLAGELVEAERLAKPVDLLTDRFPSLQWEQARAVARATDELRRAAGEQLIGYKLGWTSLQMRQALGIERPNWGTLWRRQVLTDGSLDRARFIHPKVEPELVYRSTKPLGSTTSSDEVNASGEWALGLEIVDPRFPSFEFDWLDNTADNSSSGAVVVGPFHALQQSPADIEVTFDGPGDRRQGMGANAMGDPAAAVAWLMDQLAAERIELEVGAIVFTGGLTAPFDIAPGDAFSLRNPLLGTVEFTAR